MSVIIGNKLVLEPVTLELARNREALAEELGVPIDEAWPNSDFQELIDSDVADETQFWAVIHVAERRMIGEIGTKTTTHDPPFLSGKVVEIGYSLVPAYRGQGLGTEAVRLLCDWLFAVATVSAIRAETEPDNLASAGVLLKNGFEALGQSNGVYVFERK